MKNDHCDLIHPKGVIEKKMNIKDGITIKYHADGKTMWSKGLITHDQIEGYWE